MKIWFFIVPVIFISNPLFPQEPGAPEIIHDIAEELAANDQDPETTSSYTDRLHDLYENPVNLNTGDEDEISRLFFLTTFQVKALANYIKTTGRLVSFNELISIPGFDRQTAEMIIPFATIMDIPPPQPDSVIIRNSFLTNFTLKSGKTDTSYLGSPVKFLARYRISAGHFSSGFTTEKDQGEKYITGRFEPDFFSGHICYTGQGSIKKIILGDYSARFGTGIAINTGINMGLALTSQSFMNPPNEIRPYTSTDENNFFRGIAGAFSFRNIDVSIFCSANRIDATLVTALPDSQTFIKSFYRSGIHNTESLLQHRDKIRESMAGANIAMNRKNLRLGILWSVNTFSLPVLNDSASTEKLFSFSGRENTNGSIYYNAMIHRILLSGEISANAGSSYAALQTISFRPSDRLFLNILVWKYSQGYMAFHGRGPGSSGSYPEESILGNFTFEAARHLFISGGLCVQHYPWLKYRCSSPSLGIRRELRLKYLPSERLSFECLYSYRLSMVDDAGSSGIPDLSENISRSLKAVARYSVSDNLIFSTRVDYKTYCPGKSRGTLLLEDLTYRLRSVPLSLWMRFCIFSSDDYDSRIFTWENDLLYSFSVPSMYGKGNRSYIMAAWKIRRRSELRFRYGILTKYETSGGFTDTSDFRVQLRIAI